MSMISLFESLKNDAENKDLQPDQKEELIHNIKSLDEKGYELFFVLVKLYEMDTIPNTTNGLPYECKFIAKEYRFDLEKFPDRLKQILFKFTTMHIKNIQEEDQISSERKSLNV